MKRILDHNGITRETFAIEDDKIYIEKEQNVAPILEANKRDLNSGKIGESSNVRHLGRIPIEVWQAWKKENPNIDRDQKALLKKLRDPDNRFFLTVPVNKV